MGIFALGEEALYFLVQFGDPSLHVGHRLGIFALGEEAHPWHALNVHPFLHLIVLTTPALPPQAWHFVGMIMLRKGRRIITDSVSARSHLQVVTCMYTTL